MQDAGGESAKSVAYRICSLQELSELIPRVVACGKIPFSSLALVLEELFLTHLHCVGKQQREF